MWISQTPWQRHRDTASPTGPDMMIPGERETVMDRAAGADQANAVRELIMRQFSFEGPRLYSEQGRHFLELMTGLNAGLSDFLVRRGNRNVEACTRLMQSRSLPEIFFCRRSGCAMRLMIIPRRLPGFQTPTPSCWAVPGAEGSGLLRRCQALGSFFCNRRVLLGNDARQVIEP